MARYMITYLGMPRPATPEEGKAHMEKYMAWLAGLGETAISPANPLKNTCVVQSDGSVTEGGQTGMSGFTLVNADSLDAAKEIAGSCPFLEVGGALEVSEIVEMPGG